jgi:phosphoribosylformimino-5-aminoimidazole carboxamide ribotide isomerase
MIIFPAIDIRAGRCVRLTEGRFDKETVFSDHPAEMAARWQSEGAEFLHLVDLDGALAGQPMNMSVVGDIIAAVSIPVQLGGGIRTIANVEAALSAGVQRVIIGSAAVRDPQLVAEMGRLYGDRIVVGIDARDGQVAVDGWGLGSGISAGDLASEMAKLGVTRIIYTDISRDGTLNGVNVAATVKLARVAGIPVIASGGVSSIQDIIDLMAVHSAGIEGVIVGKAMYTGALQLPEAIRIAREDVI